jgi:hypothetical protein
VPHYVLISPFESPVLYALFGLRWGCSIICILISLYFYRLKREAWWLLMAGAFAMPLIFEVIVCLSHGLPLLPYGLRTIRQPTKENFVTVSTLVKISYNQWSFFPAFMAIALGWAYLAERKRRADGPTAT